MEKYGSFSKFRASREKSVMLATLHVTLYKHWRKYHQNHYWGTRVIRSASERLLVLPLSRVSPHISVSVWTSQTKFGLIHHKFLFEILTCVKCNYLYSHLQVRLGDANRIVTLFFYFSHICAFDSSAPLGTLPSLSIEFNLMTNFFQVPDQWNSIDLADFSSARPMEFH